MTTLLHPQTHQPCAFVASQRGYIQLRCDYVTPQTRWFSQAAIEAANPVYTCEHDPRLTGMVYDQPQPILTVILTPELARNINHVAGMRILSLENNISLYHESMAA